MMHEAVLPNAQRDDSGLFKVAQQQLPLPTPTYPYLYPYRYFYP